MRYFAIFSLACFFLLLCRVFVQFSSILPDCAAQTIRAINVYREKKIPRQEVRRFNGFEFSERTTVCLVNCQYEELFLATSSARRSSDENPPTYSKLGCWRFPGARLNLSLWNGQNPVVRICGENISRNKIVDLLKCIVRRLISI